VLFRVADGPNSSGFVFGAGRPRRMPLPWALDKLLSFCRKYIMPLRMRVHDREPLGAALRRFKKLLERTGMQKELRKRKYYEKPCEARRRAKMRKLNSIRRGLKTTTNLKRDYSP
jgi:small subunit ribosomal protein S21